MGLRAAGTDNEEVGLTAPGGKRLPKGLPRGPLAKRTGATSQAHRGPILAILQGTLNSAPPTHTPPSKYIQGVAAYSRLKSVPPNFTSTQKLIM